MDARVKPGHDARVGSLAHWYYAFFAPGVILALVGSIGPASMVPMGLYASAFVAAIALFVLDQTRRRSRRDDSESEIHRGPAPPL